MAQSPFPTLNFSAVQNPLYNSGLQLTSKQGLGIAYEIDETIDNPSITNTGTTTVNIPTIFYLFPQTQRDPFPELLLCYVGTQHGTLE